MLMFKTNMKLIVSFVVFFGLSGCGLKGPLYEKPPEKPESEKTQPQKAPEQKNNQQEK